MASRTPLPGIQEGVVGKGAMRYPDLRLCYDRYAYKSGPTLPQLDDYYEDISPQKREEQKRISDLTKKVAHPSVNKAKFFKTEYVSRRLQNKEVYSSFSSLNDSIFASGEDEEEVTKASAALNYSEASESEPLKSRNRNIHIPYRPTYRPTIERVFQECSAQVFVDVHKGTCPKAAPVDKSARVPSVITIPRTSSASCKAVRSVWVERKSEFSSCF